MSSLQLLQTFPILCSTWTTTSSTGKVWMRGSCTACDRLQSRLCSVQPWDFAVWGQPFPLALGCLSPCKPKGPLSCFCSTPSIHMSVHTETTEGLSDRQLQQWPRWLYNPVRWELWQTDTDTQHPYELLVPLRHSQCSWSSDMTERGSLRASWQSIRPLITMVALLSACEVAVLVKKTACLLKEQATLEGWKCGLDTKVSNHRQACARSKAGRLPLSLEAPPWKNTPLFFVVVFFLQYIHVSLRNTSKLTGSCHNRQVGGDALFLGQRVDLYFRPLLTDENLNIVIIGN